MNGLFLCSLDRSENEKFFFGPRIKTEGIYNIVEFSNSRTSEEDVKGKAPAGVRGNGPAEIQTTDSSRDVAFSSESFPTPILHVIGSTQGFSIEVTL